MVGKWLVAPAVCLALLSAVAPQEGHAQTTAKTLNVLSYGGSIDDSIRKALADFEKRNDVTIHWVPGSSTERAAKMIGTKANPEYDVGLLDTSVYDSASKAGVLAKFDPSIMTNLSDARPEAKVAANDSVAIGFYIPGFFYNDGEFRKRGWEPPKSWNDLFKPEFCNHIGLMDATISYTLSHLIILAGGDLNKMPEAIDKFATLKNCVRTLEPSAPKLEEKIQLGEYLVGVHGSVRVIPLSLNGYPIKFVTPSDGVFLWASTCSAAAGGKQEKLAQQLCNELISPAAQKILMENSFFLPVNRNVDVPPKLIELGLPPVSVLSTAIKPDGPTIAEHRREWNRKLDRAMAR